jgi:hypothetical protein
VKKIKKNKKKLIFSFLNQSLITCNQDMIVGDWRNGMKPIECGSLENVDCTGPGVNLFQKETGAQSFWFCFYIYRRPEI